MAATKYYPEDELVEKFSKEIGKQQAYIDSLKEMWQEQKKVGMRFQR